MAGTTAWDNLSYELSNANAKDFNKKALSLLRIFDASFQISSELPGFDFFTHSKSNDEGKFGWVVQSQVFDTSLDLSEESAHQIGAIAQSFLDAGFICDKYWILHNHQHGNRGAIFLSFLSKLNEYRVKLESSKKINNVLVVPRQDFINEAQKKFKKLLTSLLQNYSDKYRLDIEHRLDFGKYYIENVPAEESEINFKPYEVLPDFIEIDSNNNQKVSDIVISERKDIRWTLIHGEAGAGKTTTALHSASSKRKIVFFVNCDVLNFDSLHLGTNVLFELILRSLNILDDEFEDETDRELFYSLSGATLVPILAHSENHILIFDGLDENRFYSDPNNQGLKRLSDRLSDIACPIVLVTRTSHFKETLFSELVTLSGSRGATKSRKKARAVKLSNWTEKHIIQVIDKILEATEENLDARSRQRIERFKSLFIDNSYKEFYGELPKNPLFLQFILSDVVERDIQRVNRPTLIYEWIRRKILRDFEKENRSFVVDKSLFKLQLLSQVDKILYTMECTAQKMIDNSSENKIELTEYTNSQEVEKITKSVFQLDQFEMINLLLNSVLTSHATLNRNRYRSTRQKITFTFKIFQEYFLACSLVRNNESYEQYPINIRLFCEEIRDTNSDEELWRYLRENFNTASREDPRKNLLYNIDIIAKGVEKMSSEPQTRNIKANNYYEQGTHTHTHNYAADESTKQQVSELRQFVIELQQSDQPTTEAQGRQVIKERLGALQQTDQSRWQKIKNQALLLKRQILNPERHWTASKAAIAEVAKHYLQESVTAKAFITYIDTMSADVGEGE